MLFQKSLLLLAAAFFGWAAARFCVLPVGVGRSRFGDAYWRRGPEAASRGLLRARGGDRLPVDWLPAISIRSHTTAATLSHRKAGGGEGYFGTSRPPARFKSDLIRGKKRSEMLKPVFTRFLQV